MIEVGIPMVASNYYYRGAVVFVVTVAVVLVSNYFLIAYAEEQHLYRPALYLLDSPAIPFLVTYVLISPPSLRDAPAMDYRLGLIVATTSSLEWGFILVWA